MTVLPTAPFGSKEITRLILGGNPLRGNSHFSKEMDEDMRRYFTVSRIKETLFAAERHGINTVQARGDVLIQQCIREYWDEGGAMHFIAQTASELRDLHGHVKQLAEFGACGIYVHGTFTDRHFLAGDMGEVRDLTRFIRDAGVQVGVGTHIPEVIDLVEEENWDVDFYMACLYNLSVRSRDSALVGNVFQCERFDHEDRFKILKRVRRTAKTCLVFKVLGAGRLCASPGEVRTAFATVLAAIKPRDAIVVGMFPKYRDQVAENCAFVREVLSGARE
jgi:hypothetical protein